MVACLVLPGARASLIINEVFNSNNGNREWIEFLVTTDIALGALDSYWFGDANASTGGIQTISRFDSASILSNVSHFTSTSDIIKAGTILVVGGNQIATDTNYNPNFLDPTDDASWNLTFSRGIGFNSSRPANLANPSDVVWLSSSQPTGATDFSNLVAAVAYLNSTDPYGGGALSDHVTLQSGSNSSFQTIHKGNGFDGRLGNNVSISNLGNNAIQFGNSEGAATRGLANGGANTAYIHSLRAVPEPGAFVPLLLAGAIALHFRMRRRKGTATAAA